MSLASSAVAAGQSLGHRQAESLRLTRLEHKVAPTIYRRERGPVDVARGGKVRQGHDGVPAYSSSRSCRGARRSGRRRRP